MRSVCYHVELCFSKTLFDVQTEVTSVSLDKTIAAGDDMVVNELPAEVIEAQVMYIELHSGRRYRCLLRHAVSKPTVSGADSFGAVHHMNTSEL